MKPYQLLAAITFAIQFFAIPVSAQTTKPIPALTDFEVHTVFTDNPPFIDGNLNDPAWQDIPPITTFTQVWPNDGAPATEDTEVRIACNRDKLTVLYVEES